MAVRSSTCPDGRSRSKSRYAPAQSIADAVGDLIGATDGGILCFLPGAAEIRRAVEDVQWRLRGANVAVVPLLRCALRSRPGRRASPRDQAARHRRDQHRGDIGDRSGRHGRRRQRSAESRAVRCRARHGQPRRRAHHAGRCRSAGRTRRSRRAWCGAEVVGRARSAASASRGGNPSRRSLRRPARRDRLGRRSPTFRMVRTAATGRARFGDAVAGTARARRERCADGDRRAGGPPAAASPARPHADRGGRRA